MQQRLTQESGCLMTNITPFPPNQMLLNYSCIAPTRKIYFTKEFLLFKVRAFHNQRPVLLKSAMQKYEDLLAFDKTLFTSK